MISTRDLSSLPGIDALRRLMQSLAMLDAILSPDWEYRYFSFNRRWSPGEQMGSMRNGQGDHYFALFDSAGCWVKGFDHNAPMSPFRSDPPMLTAGLFDGVPSEFQACLTEPAFVTQETTFCVWRLYSDGHWQSGPVQFPVGEADPDGSGGLLRYLDGFPGMYRDWATEYYECEVPLDVVRLIYAHDPLDQRKVTRLNANLSLSDLKDDFAEIGYPSKGDGRTAAG